MRPSVHRSLLTLATIATLTASGAASAQVRYDFTAFSSFDINGEKFSGSFSVELPGFVTMDTSVPATSLLSCTVVTSPAAPAQCRNQEFLFGVAAGTTTISFGVQTDLNPDLGIFYYFDGAAFSTPGTHDSMFFGNDQAGRLTVSVVPEPGQWALLALGLAVVGARTRRQRDTRV